MIISLIIPFVVGFLSQIDNTTPVEKAVATLRIISTLLSRGSNSPALKSALLKNKGNILVHVEERVLQHRKRRVRQSGRVVFSTASAFKWFCLWAFIWLMNRVFMGFMWVWFQGFWNVGEILMSFSLWNNTFYWL